MLTVAATLLAVDGERPRADRVADALGDVERAFRRRLGQQHDELVAAVARRHVGGAQLGLDRVRHLAQQAVAGFVAVGVVHRLQVVAVDHQHARRRGRSACAWPNRRLAAMAKPRVL